MSKPVREAVPFSLDAELPGLGYTPADILRLIAADIESRRKSVEKLGGTGTFAAPAAKITPRRRSLKPKAVKVVKTLVKRARAKNLGSAPAAAASAPKPPKPAPKPAGTRPPLSPEARANIVAAQKKRWANYHAAKDPAA